MIKDINSLSISEAKEFVGENDAAETFMKKFSKLKPEEGKQIRKKLKDLDLMKVKEGHISKIIDLMPETKEDLNKIFVDSSLDEEESNKILDVIKEFK